MLSVKKGEEVKNTKVYRVRVLRSIIRVRVVGIKRVFSIEKLHMMSRDGAGHREKVVVVPMSCSLVIRVVPVVEVLTRIQVGAMVDNHLLRSQVVLLKSLKSKVCQKVKS